MEAPCGNRKPQRPPNPAANAPRNAGLAGQAKRLIRVSSITADDDFRALLTFMINNTNGFRVSSAHASPAAALRDLPKHKPDIIIVDGGPADPSAAAVVKGATRLMTQTRVLICGAVPGAADIVRWLQAGAAGYVLKSAPPEEMARTLTELARGGVSLCREAQRAVHLYFSEIDLQLEELPLTQRQREVAFHLVCHRKQDVATLLGVSSGTIDAHVKAIYDQVGCIRAPSSARL